MRSFFTEFHETKNEKVTVANGQHMMSKGVGDRFLNCALSDEKYKIPVMYPPWRVICCQSRNLLDKATLLRSKVTVAAF